MKKTLFYFAVLCAAMLAGVSCEKIEQPVQVKDDSQEVIESELPEGGDYVVKFSLSMADDQTRTGFDSGTGIEWKEGDIIVFYQRFFQTEDADQMVRQPYTYTVTGDTKEIDANASFANPYKNEVHYVAFYPKSNMPGGFLTLANKLMGQISLPENQIPSRNSYDPKADILISKYLVTTPLEKPTSFKLQFERMNAIGKMTIKNLQSASDISSLTFTAKKQSDEEVVLAGSTYYKFDDAIGYTRYDYTESSTPGYNTSKQTAITLDYSSIESFSLSGESGGTAYFCCYPFELGAGDSFKLVITTTAGEVFTRTVIIPNERELKFERGKGTKFTVDMSTADQDEATVTIDGETVSYGTINAALNATNEATSPATIKLMNSCQMQESYNVANTVTLDLNGYTLTQNGPKRLGVNGGTLTLTSSQDNGVLTNSISGSNVLEMSNGGTINVEKDVNICSIEDATAITVWVNPGSEKQSNFTLNGGKIDGKSATAISVAGEGVPVVNIQSGEIVGNGSYGAFRIENTSANENAIVQITGGTIRSTDSYALNLYSGNVRCEISGTPVIESTNISVVNVDASSNLTVSGGTFSKEVPEGYISNEVESVYKYKKSDSEYFQYFLDIDKALEIIENTCEIKLLKDCNKDSDEVTLDNTKELTLDLNGNTLTLSGNKRITPAGGKLTIKDSGTTGVYTNTSNNSLLFDYSSGELILEGGTIQACSEGKNKVIVVQIKESGSFNMKGGKITDNGIGARTLVTKSSGETQISNGEITSNSTALSVEGTGEVTITGKTAITSYAINNAISIDNSDAIVEIGSQNQNTSSDIVVQVPSVTTGNAATSAIKILAGILNMYNGTTVGDVEDLNKGTGNQSAITIAGGTFYMHGGKLFARRHAIIFSGNGSAEIFGGELANGDTSYDHNLIRFNAITGGGHYGTSLVIHYGTFKSCKEYHTFGSGQYSNYPTGLSVITVNGGLFSEDVKENYSGRISVPGECHKDDGEEYWEVTPKTN